MLGKSNKKYYKSNLLCAALLAINMLEDAIDWSSFLSLLSSASLDAISTLFHVRAPQSNKKSSRMQWLKAKDLK
jgi:hypothetical protein